MKELELFAFEEMCIWAYTEEQAQILFLTIKHKTKDEDQNHCNGGTT